MIARGWAGLELGTQYIIPAVAGMNLFIFVSENMRF
jgi:hypothetical protein